LTNSIINQSFNQKFQTGWPGQATNNIAELTAIKRTLEYLKGNCDKPIIVYTDCQYSIGILTKNWKAKANVELVESIRELMRLFTDMSLEYVKGHGKHPGNEKADRLAVKGRDTC
jgi:ribonuclease HI